MRSMVISLISVALTTAVIANAYYQKKQFYPSVVYITKSNPSMAVIYYQAVICVLWAGKLMRRIFFGELRTTEFEHLMERLWYAIIKICLALTIFRDDFSQKFVALFILLLFLKSFHWLAEDRVDYMGRSPIIGWLFHVRILSLLLLLGSLDLYFMEHAFQSTDSKGAALQLVFGFEYAFLMTLVINVVIKYALYLVDLNRETPWDNRAVFMLYTKLIMGLIRVVLYLLFLIIMVRIYTLPLFVFRPMYYAILNFKKAFNDVRLSRRAIHNMNTLYPDATPEELNAGDNICVICREEMSTGCKKLPCNHIFHTACLRLWFQRQQTCPTCRFNILRTSANDRREQRQRPAANVPPFQNFNPNFRNLQQQQQPQPNQVPNIVLPNNGNNNAQPQANVNSPTPPVPPPPFQFPPLPSMNPFMTPSPMPPQNLASLTTEQLRQLEGNERENVEARMQWLRNIQVMLDAAVIMKQQYNTAAALSMAMPNVPQPTAGANTNTECPLSSEPSTTNEASTPIASTSTATISLESSISVDSATSLAGGDVDNNKSDMPNTSSSEPNTVSSVEEEVRRRRLQKFEQVGQN